MTRPYTDRVLAPYHTRRVPEPAPEPRPELHPDCNPSEPVTLCPECRKQWDEALREAGQGTLLPEGDK